MGTTFGTKPIGRTRSADPPVDSVCLASDFFIVVAPVFLSAAAYLSLSVLPATATSASRVSRGSLTPRRILGLFVTADVVTTILQVAGAALVGVGYSRQADGQVPPLTPEQANNILLAGLAVQLAFFTLFTILLSTFVALGLSRHSMSAATTTNDKDASAPTGSRRDIATMSVIWVASVSLLLRIAL